MDEKSVFPLRMPMDIRKFVAKMAYEQEISKNKVIVNCIEKYKKDLKNMLTFKK